MKLLVDECLHTSLTGIAHAAGHIADHVNYLGLDSAKDWQILTAIRNKDYTFVTNNRSDFLALYGHERLHSGLIIIVPNVAPARQHELFAAVRQHVGSRDLTNTVVEVDYAKGQVECREYAWPATNQIVF